MAAQRNLLGSKSGEPVEGSLRIWQEDDRLLVELRAIGAPTAPDVHEEGTQQLPWDDLVVLSEDVISEEAENAPSPDDGPEMFAKLTEADWLEAELLVLQKEAIERAGSLDATLAYVSERCAAVGRS